jgi:hypothetical protein
MQLGLREATLPGRATLPLRLVAHRHRTRGQLHPAYELQVDVLGETIEHYAFLKWQGPAPFAQATASEVEQAARFLSISVFARSGSKGSTRCRE